MHSETQQCHDVSKVEGLLIDFFFTKLATGQLDRSEKMPLKREAQINYDRVTQVRSLTIVFEIKKFPLLKEDTG